MSCLKIIITVSIFYKIPLSPPLPKGDTREDLLKGDKREDLLKGDTRGVCQRWILHISLKCPFQETSKIKSISRGAFKGKTFTPTVDLACFPLSPKISKSKSEAAFNTFGCSVKSGDEAM